MVLWGLADHELQEITFSLFQQMTAVKTVD
jgi:hypothetical protein